MITKTKLFLIAKKYKRKNCKDTVIFKNGCYWGFIGHKGRVPLYGNQNLFTLKGKLPF